MTQIAEKKRTRLSPEQRRMQLLDSAKQLIKTEGLSSLTMEAVAEEAGVSNPLMYKYFSTRLALLQDLLLREFDHFYGEIEARLHEAESFEQVVDILVRTNFEEVRRGNMVSILYGQKDVAAVLKEPEKALKRRAGHFLTERLMRAYALSPDQVEHLIIMSSGASQAAAAWHGRHGGDEAQMIEDVKRFILAGYEVFRT